jgi:hypothetical protein
MIRVSLTLLIMVYMGLLVGLIGVVWFYSAVKVRREERLAFKYRVRCGICGFIYEDKGEEVLSRCPSCNSLNERFNREAL